ncbi:MAG: amidohydrolase family protein [Pseudohongiellaceae bacterium]
MTQSRSFLLFAVLVGSLLTGVSALAQPAGQTVLLHNVNGYTLDSQRELVSFHALQFTGDTVERVYREGESLPGQEGQRRIDGQGRTLLPGLIDAHGHVLSYGLSLLRVDLTGTATEAEAADRVRNFLAANDGLQWVQGRGWNQVLWDSNAFPEATSLDAVADDTPVWLTRVDGHAGWANSAAMELAGIDASTADPEGGQILRDDEGRPTGVFVDNAMSLISRHIPDTSLEERKYALQQALESLASQGLTSVHDASVSALTVQAYQELQAEGAMPVRVNAMLAATDPELSRMLEEGHVISEDGMFKIDSVKISADGALGSRGAALIEEYSDDPGNRGLLLHEPNTLVDYMEQAMEAGFQVNIHAIGDRANQLVLDGFEQLIPATGTRDLRHRVEHAQVLRYEDILRFDELGVIASMQATHATSDKNMAEDRLGSERILGAYAWRSLLEAGATIANGSDFPVESPNPFYGLHAAITRQDHQDQPPGGWYPEERMTAAEAFTSFTLDAALAGHQEDRLGTLEPGKAADFILVDRDIFAVEPADIWETQVLETWVNGERVSRAE